ncbi:MAG: AAA family ATPase, partial [Anaerolineae bacterium]|nr:AAA family ATPase [Anaerolineae bacterium]
MRISNVRLENWRNFQEVDVPLAYRAFLIGPNASGKSNFLDAFRFLRDIVTPGGGFEASVNTRGGVSRIRNLAARRQPDVVVDVKLQEQDQPGSWRYRLGVGQDPQRRPILKQEQVWHYDGRLLLDRPDNDDKKDRERLRQTHLEQTFANQQFREIAECFASIDYSHIVPQLIRDPDRYISRTVDPFGGDFLERIASANQKV